MVWTWDTRIEITPEGREVLEESITCPVCGENIYDPFSECLDCEKERQRFAVRSMNALLSSPSQSGYPTLAERLASDMTADRFNL